MQLRGGASPGTNPASEPMTELECPHCGYGWDYGGQLLSATCPSCKGTVRVDDQTEAETENEA